MKMKNLEYNENFENLGENQFGFRIPRMEKEKMNVSITVFVDLKKAFDPVNHSLLLKKLEIFGFRGPVLSWISSYLNSGTQFVLWKKRV